MSNLSPPSPDVSPDVIARAMERAIAEAEAFRGATAPNPPVGCTVLDRDGTVLASGAHRRAGMPHAEAAALARCRDAGTLGRVDTVVVTLEPCNHWGRTPPCVEAILATPARAVVIGTRDPNPTVAGDGADRLRQAGLAVSLLPERASPWAGDLSARCVDLIAPFAKRSKTGQPWVTVKQALDPAGSMIPPHGVKTFTSEPALRYAHELRKRADAILTGSGTVLADRPEFTVRRVADHPARIRQLAILDRRRRVPPDAVAASETRNFVVLLADDLTEALDRLGAAGALEVLVEAGPAVTRSVLESGLWDEHISIRKGAGRDGADLAEVRRRGVAAIRRIDLL